MSTLTAVLGVLLVVVAAGPAPPHRPVRRARRTVALHGRRRWWAVASAAALAGFAVQGAVAAGVGAAVAVAVPVAQGQIRRRRKRAATAAAIPDLVELFLIAASAGLPVAASLRVVAPRAPAAVRQAVARAGDEFARGLPLDDCLARLSDALGPGGGPVVDALRQAAAAGVPLVPLLEGVAAAARDGRRRQAQEAARRLPVTMLFPLVFCVLPAAVLLAVVPVLVVSVTSLDV